MRTEEYYQSIGAEILDACLEVHKVLGPGLLESVYEFALMKEFKIRKIEAQSQFPVKLFYKGFDTGKYFHVDILIDNEVMIELKAVETLNPISKAQLLTYLKLSGHYLGYVVNFNVPLLKQGFNRFTNRRLETER